MSNYRSGAPCEFCADIAAMTCPRCQCQVCERHRSAPMAATHCVVCEKEARDDAEVARFRGAVLHVDEPRSPFGRGRSASVLEVVTAWLGRLAFGRATRPEMEPEVSFDRRTPEQIRAWRRKAGVHTRS